MHYAFPFRDLDLHNGTTGVYFVVILSGTIFLIQGAVLIYGAHEGSYEGRQLTWRRWLFPYFLVRFGRTGALVYGYFFGIWFICIGLSALRTLTR
jgi:hypothetical protein